MPLKVALLPDKAFFHSFLLRKEGEDERRSNFVFFVGIQAKYVVCIAAPRYTSTKYCTWKGKAGTFSEN